MRAGHDKVPSSVSSQRVLEGKDDDSTDRESINITRQLKLYKSPTLSSCPTIGSEQSKSRHSSVPCVPAGSPLPSFSERRGVFRNKGPFERGVTSIADLEREVEAGFVWI
jgi:hypothetical protein